MTQEGNSYYIYWADDLVATATPTSDNKWNFELHLWTKWKWFMTFKEVILEKALIAATNGIL